MSIKHEKPQQRFDDETTLYLEDYDGLGLELVASKKDQRPGYTYGNVPLEHAIRGFYGITLSEEGYEKTADLLTSHMDHVLVAQKSNRFRYAPKGKSSDFVDILCSPDSLPGFGGGGTIHHVAFATSNDNTQLQVRDKLIKSGFNATPVIDREYFHSVYFREPGGVLFEIATLPPGFAIDEPLDHLGETLKLPPWQERNRAVIESLLMPIHLDVKRFVD